MSDMSKTPVSKTEIQLVYIDDLDNNNYKSHIKTMRENVNTIIQIANLSVKTTAKLIGICRLALRRFIVLEKDNIRFLTASKLNNFVYNVCLREDFSIEGFERVVNVPKLVKPAPRALKLDREAEA